MKYENFLLHGLEEDLNSHQPQTTLYWVGASDPKEAFRRESFILHPGLCSAMRYAHAAQTLTHFILFW